MRKTNGKAEENGTAYIGARVSNSTKRKLDAMSTHARRSLSAEIALALERHTQNEPDPGPPKK